MNPYEVKDYFKTGYNFKEITGMSASTLANWLLSGTVPPAAQARLQLITNGALKADPVTQLLKMTKELQDELFELREYKIKNEEYLIKLEQEKQRMIK
jgi:hypothetical protein